MKKRQNDPWLGDIDRLLTRSLALGYAKNYRVAQHNHPWDQLIYAHHGVLNVHTETETWMVPPHRAFWVPAGMDHGLSMFGSVFLKTLYLLPGLSSKVYGGTINVSPLLRQLILHVVNIGMLSVEIPQHPRLLRVLLDQLDCASSAPFQLPMPQDPRAKKVADLLLHDPSTHISLAELALSAGASKRTMERLFLGQTQLTFGKWRERTRLLHGLRLLAAGETVTAVSLEVGYRNTSTFIARFKRTFGKTPGQFRD